MNSTLHNLLPFAIPFAYALVAVMATVLVVTELRSIEKKWSSVILFASGSVGFLARLLREVGASAEWLNEVIMMSFIVMTLSFIWFTIQLSEK
jgi:hypothetical protein